MGASLQAAAFNHHRNNNNTIIHAKPRERNLVMEVPSTTAPDYRFDEFIHLCEERQRRKRVIEEKLRVTLENVRVTSNAGDANTAEAKHCAMKLISQFRSAQEEQNLLIQKEHLRFEMLQNELGSTSNSNKANLRKMRNRLKYFISLNKDHERIIDKIRDHRGSQKTGHSDLRQRCRSVENEEFRT